MSAQRCPGDERLGAPAVRNGPAVEAADWTGGEMSGGASRGSRLFSPTDTSKTGPANAVPVWVCSAMPGRTHCTHMTLHTHSQAGRYAGRGAFTSGRPWHRRGLAVRDAIDKNGRDHSGAVCEGMADDFDERADGQRDRSALFLRHVDNAAPAVRKRSRRRRAAGPSPSGCAYRLPSGR